MVDKKQRFLFKRIHARSFPNYLVIVLLLAGIVLLATGCQAQVEEVTTDRLPQDTGTSTAPPLPSLATPTQLPPFELVPPVAAELLKITPEGAARTRQTPLPQAAETQPPAPEPTNSELARVVDEGSSIEPPAAGTEATAAVLPTPTPQTAATLTPSGSLPITVTEIGLSAGGHPLKAYQINDGPRRIIFVGGIHGGYEWNSILLAYQALDYFQANPRLIPESVSLIIIPSANPDGQLAVTGTLGVFDPTDIVGDTFPGRFNANGVDLNRNWNCEWSPTALWRKQEVSGGTTPFSEPESRALRDFFTQEPLPEVVVFYHSAANGVFAAGCPDTHQSSWEWAMIYGQAAGYPVHERFNIYPVTGDAGDWLTKLDIPSISIELKNHEDLEWTKNIQGMLAILDQYSD